MNKLSQRLIDWLTGNDGAKLDATAVLAIDDDKELQARVNQALEKAAGIALGIFEDCKPDDEDPSLSLKETLKDRLGNLGIPVVYGLSFGHIENMCTLPVGITAELDAENKTLTLLEPAVV